MAANPSGGNLRIASSSSNGPAAVGGGGGGVKVDPKDPQVRKLVYNMYRGMLDQKHQRANVILETAPQEMVAKDEGVGSRVQSMMRQQNELKSGNIHAGGAPPPPPPPPIPGVLQSSRLPSENQAAVAAAAMNPPAALAGAMMKDKKPFTYTPGGLDLSEINSQNGGDPLAPVQSRSFKLLQNVLDTQDTTDPQGPVHIPNLRQQPQQQQQALKPQSAPSHHYQHQPNYQQSPSHFQHTPGQYQHPGGPSNPGAVEQEVPEPKKYMGGSIPSRSFRMLQAMTSPDDAVGPGLSDL